MKASYYQGNRERLYAMLKPGSLLLFFPVKKSEKRMTNIIPSLPIEILSTSPV